jgi:hypothetical protein
VLGNFITDSSRQTRLELEESGQKFKLHFLPPHGPDHNRIERKVWREMHANMTINHRRRTPEELMGDAIRCLQHMPRAAVFVAIKKANARRREAMQPVESRESQLTESSNEKRLLDTVAGGWRAPAEGTEIALQGSAVFCFANWYPRV